MPVEWNRGAVAQSPLVADRNLYLDASNSTVVEEGDARSASQLVATGHPISQADADRLGLVMKGDRVVQDRAVKIGEHQALVDQLDAERRTFYEAVEQYRRENATKDIPNTMEAARVALETRYEHAVLALNQFIKAGAGKDPLRGESQATALEPEKSETAKRATKQANAAVSASPSPVDLAKAAPSGKSEVAPQHPPTTEGATPAPEPGARDNPSKVLTEPAAKSAKKSPAKRKKG
jgi:enoyl-CoA hydratase/carnithine racemase